MVQRICLLLTLALVLPALCLAGRMEIRKPAYEQVLAYESQGYSVKDDIQIGELPRGKSYYFNTQLTTGLDYLFHFEGDVGVRKVRLEIFDENWKLAATSEGAGQPAVIQIKPQWSGTFHVKATLVDSKADYDFWFILAGYR